MPSSAWEGGLSAPRVSPARRAQLIAGRVSPDASYSLPPGYHDSAAGQAGAEASRAYSAGAEASYTAASYSAEEGAAWARPAWERGSKSG